MMKAMPRAYAIVEAVWECRCLVVDAHLGAGERASLGSRLHPDNCNPCIFWFKDKARQSRVHIEMGMSACEVT